MHVQQKASILKSYMKASDKCRNNINKILLQNTAKFVLRQDINAVARHVQLFQFEFLLTTFSLWI